MGYSGLPCPVFYGLFQEYPEVNVMYISGNAFKWKQGSKTPDLFTGSSEVNWQGCVLITASGMSKENVEKQEKERKEEK